MKGCLVYARYLILLATAIFIGFAHSSAYAADSSIAVSNVWAKATPNGATTAAIYLTIQNNGREEDQLISISTVVAEEATVHTMMTKGAVMEMRGMEAGLPVPAEGKIVLEPHSRHIMLEGLKRPLVSGDAFDLSLHFLKAGIIKTAVVVKPLGYSN